MAERSTIVKIRGVVVQRIRGLCAAWSSSCKTAGFVCMVLLSLLLEGCMRPPSSNPLTLTFLDPGTSPAEVNAALQGFTQETGIQVKHLPAPESSVASEPKSQLDLSQKLATQEKEMIEAALRESGGRVSGASGAAARLGIHRSTLESKITSLRINKYRFKTASASKNS
jgi:hypothetical protein